MKKTVYFIAFLFLSRHALAAELNENYLMGFGQLGYVSSDKAESKNNNFYIGGLDLFYTAKISERSQFLSEVLFETTAENSTVVDIERLTVQRTFSDLLKIGIGRFHTALGFWNDNYHHGSFLHKTVDRPIVYRSRTLLQVPDWLSR